MQWFWEQYVGDVAMDSNHASLGNIDVAGFPATHVITAEYDVLRDEGEHFASRLLSAGVPTTSKRYDGMLHGFIHFAGIFDDGLTAVRDIAEVLQELVPHESNLT
jgi:acetyl esterase